MSVGAVLFDAGNTLLELDYASLAAICLRHGVRVDAERIRTAAGRARPAMDRFLTQSDHSTETRDAKGFAADLILGGLEVPADRRAGPLAEEIVAALPRLWTLPVEGAEETLRTLTERGTRCSVVSNSDGTVERFLSESGLGAYLELVIDSALVGVEKPDPEIFRIALSRMGLASGEAVYVGDLPSVDLAGAAAAGLRAVLLDPFDGFPGCRAPRIRALPELITLLASF